MLLACLAYRGTMYGMPSRWPCYQFPYPSHVFPDDDLCFATNKHNPSPQISTQQGTVINIVVFLGYCLPHPPFQLHSDTSTFVALDLSRLGSRQHDDPCQDVSSSAIASTRREIQTTLKDFTLWYSRAFQPPPHLPYVQGWPGILGSEPDRKPPALHGVSWIIPRADMKLCY
jgi:hypothetical protein